jgi:hypothetical protein
MRHFCGIGCVLSLILFFDRFAACAQFTGTTSTPQQGAAAPGSSAAASSQRDFTDQSDRDELGEPVTKKAALPPPNRVPSFNRVTTSRKELVPARSQAAFGAHSGGALAAAIDPNAVRNGNARARAANAEIPAGSSWRQQEAVGPARRPSMSVRTTTHNYYPALRAGQYLNSNTAQVKGAGKGRGMVVPRFGVGPGLGTAGTRSAQGARPGQGATTTRGAAAPPRR